MSGDSGFERRMLTPCNPSVTREVVSYGRRSGWVGNPNEESSGGFGRQVEDDSMAIWDGKKYRLLCEGTAFLKAAEARASKEDLLALLLLVLK